MQFKVEALFWRSFLSAFLAHTDFINKVSGSVMRHPLTVEELYSPEEIENPA